MNTSENFMRTRVIEIEAAGVQRETIVEVPIQIRFAVRCGHCKEELPCTYGMENGCLVIEIDNKECPRRKEE